MWLISPVSAQEPPLAKVSSNRIVVRFKKAEAMGYKMSKMMNQGVEVKSKLLLENTFTFETPEGEAVNVAEQLGADPEIEFATPNFEVHALETPNDPSFSLQWGLPKISAPEAWDLTHGLNTVKVAVLDTGIDSDHEDLAAKIDQRVKLCSGGACSSDEDFFGHGTHVAGIVAAITNNQIGVAGTGYDIHLLSVKVLNDQGSAPGDSTWVQDGIQWVLDNTDAKVISLSLGGWGYYNPGSINPCDLYQPILDQAHTQGVLVVVAAGNEGSGSIADDICQDQYGNTFRCRFAPGSCNHVLTVASTTSSDEKSSFSNYGDLVDVAAPGSNIYSTFPNHSHAFQGAGKSLNYDYLGGTSMATPFVSGLAGLLFSVDSSLTAVDVRNLIEQKADNIGHNGEYWTHGRINAYQSVLAATADVTATPTPTPTGGVTATPPPTVTPGGATPTPTPTGGVTGTPTPSPTPGGVTATPTPTSVPFNCSLDGDFDGSGTVDEVDFTLWTTAFSEGRAVLSCFEYWRRNAYSTVDPTATPTPTVEPTATITPTP